MNTTPKSNYTIKTILKNRIAKPFQRRLCGHPTARATHEPIHEAQHDHLLLLVDGPIRPHEGVLVPDPPRGPPAGAGAAMSAVEWGVGGVFFKTPSERSHATVS